MYVSLTNATDWGVFLWGLLFSGVFFGGEGLVFLFCFVFLQVCFFYFNCEYLLFNWEGENITQGNICNTHCAVMSTSLSQSTFLCLH